jgi:hypothetical protein
MLVIDGSGSISSDDFALIRKFIPGIGSRLDMSSEAGGGAQVGVIQFSDDARTEISLSFNFANLTRDAAAITQLGSGTNLAAGLSLAQTELVLHGTVLV